MFRETWGASQFAYWKMFWLQWAASDGVSAPCRWKITDFSEKRLVGEQLKIPHYLWKKWCSVSKRDVTATREGDGVQTAHPHTSEHTSLIFTSLKLKVFPGLYPHCGSFLGQVIIVCKRILGAKVKRRNEMAWLTRSSDILLLRKKLSIT